MNNRTKNFTEALRHLQMARDSLRNETRSETEFSHDAYGYIEKIEELISHDHGEAGLEALIDYINKK